MKPSSKSPLKSLEFPAYYGAILPLDLQNRVESTTIRAARMFSDEDSWTLWMTGISTVNRFVWGQILSIPSNLPRQELSGQSDPKDV